MEQLIVAADMKMSNDRKDSLIASSLGSCVGLVVYDAEVNAGGILQYVLPDSSIDPDIAEANPYMFADTGIREFFSQIGSMGAVPQRSKVYIIGGAGILNQSGEFNIGEHNSMVANTICQEKNIRIAGSNTGGMESLCVRLDIATGDVFVWIPGSIEEKL